MQLCAVCALVYDQAMRGDVTQPMPPGMTVSLREGPFLVLGTSSCQEHVEQLSDARGNPWDAAWDTLINLGLADPRS